MGDSTTMAASATAEPQPRRVLWYDVAFWGMTATQFLGAFNDNLFKQILLLLFVKIPSPDGGPDRDLQWLGMLAFALPFVLFSGYAGHLSDRYPKRRVIVLSKVAEIVVMAIGCLLFLWYSRTGLTGTLICLLTVTLFAMGAQSAFFGPGKYGILPELFHQRDLPNANGVILMTTFLAVILGTAIGGELKENFADRLWVSGMVSVAIAVVGTGTAFLIRSPAAAQPGLQLERGSLWIPQDIWELFKRQRGLYYAVLVSSVFWMVASLVMTAINGFAKYDLELPDSKASRLLSTISLGIAVGSIVGGLASKDRFNTRVMKTGLWGMVGGLLATAVLGSWLGFWGGVAMMVILGGFTGAFAVPLQVYIQSCPPEALKGRMIATQNLLNWVGILLAAGVYFALERLLKWFEWPYAMMFAAAGGMMLLVGALYHPHDVVLVDKPEIEEREAEQLEGG